MRRLGDAIAVLLVICYLATFAQIMAERGRDRLPAPAPAVAAEALSRTVAYLVDHPTTYRWHKEDVPATRLVLTTFGRSAGLLLAALGIATVIGVPLGLAMARSQRKLSSLAMLVLSALGVSTPSFLLAMFLWIVNVQAYRLTGARTLPPTGFGWDLHLVMPALVLAVMPTAQLAQVTYVTMTDVLRQDFIRTARAKGLSARGVTIQHAIPNIRVPVLTALGTSLRLSLASLLVVEYFFLWPGVGQVSLEAIRLGNAPLVTDLIVCLGAFFLAINWGLEIISPILDPRLRDNTRVSVEATEGSWREWPAEVTAALASGWQALRHAFTRRRRSESRLPPLPALPHGAATGTAAPGELPAQPGSHAIRAALTNPVLLASGALALGLLGLAAFGHGLTQANPYQIHGVMMINGKIGSPPYPPSVVFPWGTDHIGRDIQALVLAGARQTLTLAFFAMLSRMLIGIALGTIAGWRPSRWPDRLVTSGIGVWAAFPITLFAMLIIQGLGTHSEQGTWVFVVALSVVGWGEVAQFVRQQVIGVRPSLFIEAARSIGTRSSRVLTQHVMPQLLAPLLVLAALQMAAVLLLLAELGFLNVFLGGGYQVMIAESGAMQPVIAYFSDVPEWGAMLANIRNWWRSYPWMAWYPGVAFFLAILTFNLLGEGLRRFISESRVNVSRLLNRYTVLAAIVLIAGLVWLLRSSTPMGIYLAQAKAFDGERALADIRRLASPEFAGRETGTPGAQLAADYLAGRMEEIGLFPAGDANTYIQTAVSPRVHLSGVPQLEITDAQGSVLQAFRYRQDFVEQAGLTRSAGTGAIVGLASGADIPDRTGADPYRLGGLDLRDKVLLFTDPGDKRIYCGGAAGALIVNDEEATYLRRYLIASQSARSTPTSPTMYITSEAADRLLATAGSSLAELRQVQAGLAPGETWMTREGAPVRLAVPTFESEDLSEKYYTVIGYIPGTGAQAQAQTGGGGLDSQVIMVSAYYDGLGTGPDGTLYPGANDNASGAAALLELARVLKESAYAPKKTVVFVVWTGGERSEGLSVKNIMNAKTGFNALTVEAIMELSGVGAGDGEAIALGEGSSYRLVQLFQKAASRLGTATTTRGRGPHYGLPAVTGFGGRDAFTLYMSWDGSDRLAHTPEDTVASIVPERLRRLGQAALLTLSVLSRETVY